MVWYTIDRKVQILVMSCLLWQLTFSSPSGSLHSSHPAWVWASICAPSFWLQNYLFVARITLKWPLELKLVCLGSTLCLPRHLITLPWRSIMKRSLLHFVAMSYNETVTLAIVCVRGAAGFSLVKTLQFHSRLTGWGQWILQLNLITFWDERALGWRHTPEKLSLCQVLPVHEDIVHVNLANKAMLAKQQSSLCHSS